MSNERTGPLIDATKQFLEDVKKIEEKEERPMADGSTHKAAGDEEEEDEELVKKSATAPTAVEESIEDEQLNLNEGSVTSNKIDEDNLLDPNISSVTCNETVGDNKSDPTQSLVTYNKENIPADGITTNGELDKEKVKSENIRGYERSEPPADLLSGKAQCCMIVVYYVLLQLRTLTAGWNMLVNPLILRNCFL